MNLIASNCDRRQSVSTTATKEAGASAPVREPLVVLHGVSKRFGAVQALTSIDLEVPAGQVTALVGDNGAGKSVLIKTLAGNWPPDDGEIVWEGTPVHFHGPRDAEAQGIITIYQDLALCDNLDIVQNMFLGHELRRHGLLDEGPMELAARRTLEQLSVTTVRSIRQPVASLSGGQRQSVAVAKAMMGEPKLVIMDEPTAALGVAQTKMVLGLVKRLAGHGVAVILISHNLNDVFSVADRIEILHLGHLVASGPMSDFDPPTVIDYMTTGRSWAGARADAELMRGDARPVDQRSAGKSETAEEVEAIQAPEGTDQTAAPASEEATAAAAPGVLAQSLGDYLQAWKTRVRSGESGMLPVLLGLAAIVIFFQIERSQFLSSANLVNLIVQAAVFILFAAAEVYVLVLSEVDLSVGFVGAVAAFTIAELIGTNVGAPWWLAILAGFGVGAVIGVLQGTLVARLRLPAFVVTLGGLLFWGGVMLELANTDKAAVGGVMSISPSSPVFKLVNSNMSVAAGWIGLAVVIALFAVASIRRDARARAQGLTVAPLSVTLFRIALAAIGGCVLVFVCNGNRGILAPLRGVPWVVPLVGLVILAWSVLMGRTALGRYIYAIGASPQAAHRAGINVAAVRTTGFMLCSLTAAMAGLVYASWLGSISTDIPGGDYSLYGVAAAVIGGASLFGGRGKPLHALLGGFVIATVYSGLALMSVSAAIQYMATAVVLIVAVTIDSVTRRRTKAAI
jgi:D-xylose transport system permease protein